MKGASEPGEVIAHREGVLQETPSQRQFLFPVLLQGWHSDDLLISGFWKNTDRKKKKMLPANPASSPLSSQPAWNVRHIMSL